MRIMLTTMTMKNRKNLLRYIFIAVSVISALCCIVSSASHYNGRYYGNNVTWISFITGIIALLIAFFPFNGLKNKNKNRYVFSKLSVIVIVILSLFFILSHLWNFKTAPWNQNGLFDDAAWNVYFTQSYVMEGQPFQGAVHERIHPHPRETLFHYYIDFAFIIFGYNILTFNLSVLFLGFLTFLFTVLLVHRLFNNIAVTIFTALLFDFFPLHFLFCFVGQRYAIVPPLLMSSLYFLHKGFEEKSYFSISISSVLSGLCFSGAIMGRQYHMGLFGALILYLLFGFKKYFTRINWNFFKLFAAGTFLSSIPLLMYICYNTGSYFANESGYMSEFISSVKNNGIQGFMGYYKRMYDCLFGFSWYKWFIPDFPIIPKIYYVFLIPGFLIAFIKKHYHFITLSLIPPLGAFISGFSDYRVLMACPVWIVLMAFTINELVNAGKYINIILEKLNNAVKALVKPQDKVRAIHKVGVGVEVGVEVEDKVGAENKVGVRGEGEVIVEGEVGVKGEVRGEGKVRGEGEVRVRGKTGAVIGNIRFRFTGMVIVLAILLPGLFTTVKYIASKSLDPYSVRFFAQKDVAVSRMIRDISAGVSEPSPVFRHNEFRKLEDLKETDFDIFVCQNLGYAITHTFLYPYDSFKILSFSDGLPYNILSEARILSINKNVIKNYCPGVKDLKLVWEITDKTKRIISEFRKLNFLGRDELLTTQHEGHEFSLYVLTIESRNIERFKQETDRISLQ